VIFDIASFWEFNSEKASDNTIFLIIVVLIFFPKYFLLNFNNNWDIAFLDNGVPTDDLNKKIYSIDVEKNNDIEVRFDGSKLTNENFNYIVQLSQILANDEELEVGSFELDIFQISINKIKTYEKGLVVNDK